MTRKHQQAFDAMIRAYEMREDEAKLEDGRFAPLDIIYGFGLALQAASASRRQQEFSDLAAIVQDLKHDIKKVIDPVTLTFNKKAMIALGAKIFFSGVVVDNSGGSGSTGMQNAGIASSCLSWSYLYLRRRPAMLGSNGKKIMQPNNTTAQEPVKSLLRTTFTNLRNHVKERLPRVLGKPNQYTALNAYDTAAEWYKNYGVDITELRLARLSLLRIFARKKIQEDFKLPETLWPDFAKLTSKTMQQASRDDEARRAAIDRMKQMVQEDKRKYGDYEVIEDDTMLKAQREIDECILEASSLDLSLLTALTTSVGTRNHNSTGSSSRGSG
ncbi:hypothetical protein V8E36_003495, partial [Tilletia maclaganii]